MARIGEAAGADSGPFGSVLDLELGAAGTVYVLDGFSRTINIYDGSGSARAEVGGRGQGPGELDRPAGLFWGPAGQLWVYDFGTNRFTAFSQAGALVGTYRATGPQPFVPLTAHASETGFSLVGIVLRNGSLEDPVAVRSDYAVAERAVTIQDQARLPFVEWPAVFEFSNDEIGLFVPIPFAPEPKLAFDPEGRLWYGDAPRGVASRWSSSGSFDRTVGRSLPAQSLAPATLQAALAESPDVEELQQVAATSVYQEFLSRIPDTQPHLEAFGFAEDGTAWLLRTSGGAEAGVRWLDLYDAQGTLLGSREVRLAAAPPPRVRDGWIAGVERDPLGVESVTLYRIGDRLRP